MKKNFANFILLMLATSAYSQQPVLNDYDVNPGKYIEEINLPEAPNKGNFYLDKNWVKGDFVMTNSIKITNQLLRYDLQHNNLEIKLENIVKVCPIDKLEHFILYSSNRGSLYYINLKNVPFYWNINNRGIVEVLFKGNKSTLFLYTSTDIKKTTYVPSVDMGRRGNKVLKKTTYYLQTLGKLYELRNSINNNADAFGKDFSKVNQFSKEHRLKIRNRKDLIEILKFYDSL